MKIEYNGITMELVELHAYERQNIYTPDGADLLFVRHRLNMSCALAPGGNPYGMATQGADAQDPRLSPKARQRDVVGPKNGPPPLPVVTQYRGRDVFGGDAAGVSDRLLSPLLLTPRRKLRVTAFKIDATGNPVEVVWLESPRPGQPCDSMSGPHPLGCTVAEATGDAPSSGLLNFQIETHLPLSEVEGARFIVSHRWTSAITHDEDYYATRIVSGEAVFDQGMVLQFKVPPAAFLNQLYHPIPLGFKRNLPHVELSSDGCKLTYEFTDTAVPCVFDAGETGATQCWIDEEWKYLSPHGVSPAGEGGPAGNGVLGIDGLVRWSGRKVGNAQRRLGLNPGE